MSLHWWKGIIPIIIILPVVKEVHGANYRNSFRGNDQLVSVG